MSSFASLTFALSVSPRLASSEVHPPELLGNISDDFDYAGN